jgi:hypothetical protein
MSDSGTSPGKPSSLRSSCFILVYVVSLSLLLHLCIKFLLLTVANVCTSNHSLRVKLVLPAMASLECLGGLRDLGEATLDDMTRGISQRTFDILRRVLRTVINVSASVSAAFSDSDVTDLSTQLSTSTPVCRRRALDTLIIAVPHTVATLLPLQIEALRKLQKTFGGGAQDDQTIIPTSPEALLALIGDLLLIPLVESLALLPPASELASHFSTPSSTSKSKSAYTTSLDLYNVLPGLLERILSALASQVKTRVDGYANALPSLKDRLCLVTIRHQDGSLVAAPTDASLLIFIPEDEHTSMPSNAAITRSTRLSSKHLFRHENA